MSFAACGGKLYASIYDAIVVRTDGANPSWQIFYQYSGPALGPASSGFRGLTCVPNLNGAGSMLIAGLEGPGDIYDIPLDGSQPTIELNMANYLWDPVGHLGWVRHYRVQQHDRLSAIRIDKLPRSSHWSQRLAPNYAGDYEGYYPNPSFLIRHCNGAYGFQTIDPSITPAPSPIATRALAVSQFPGDPAGTIYAGGFDAHSLPAHNTDWLYKGVPK